MASNIDFISIDETYPIAGRDNDSQGFRDNFSIIKNNFESAKGEIEDLQFNAARVDQSNNFNNQNIISANFVACTEELNDGGVASGIRAVDWREGSYQIFQITGNSLFTLSNFPSGSADAVGKMKIQIQGNDTAQTVNFQVDGGVPLKKSPNVPTLPLTVNSSSEYHIFEFWTYNSGSTGVMFMDYVGPFA